MVLLNEGSRSMPASRCTRNDRPTLRDRSGITSMRAYLPKIELFANQPPFASGSMTLGSSATMILSRSEAAA